MKACGGLFHKGDALIKISTASTPDSLQRSDTILLNPCVAFFNGIAPYRTRSHVRPLVFSILFVYHFVVALIALAHEITVIYMLLCIHKYVKI